MSALLCPGCSSKLPANAKVDLIVDFDSGTMIYRGKMLPLGNAQFLVMKTLAQAKGGYVKTERLAEFFAEEANVRVAVNRLRAILGNAAIENSPGLGYRLACTFAKGSL